MGEQLDNAAYDHHLGAQPLLRPTSRRRTGIFLTLNLAGFAVANAFWRYLITGRWFDISTEAYNRGPATLLNEMFKQPLEVFAHPWMIIVTASLLAVMFFVPIVVSVLYREAFAMAGVLIVASVVHAWWLAFFLAGGCILAARTRLRSDMPFLATMLGMLPLGLYLAFAFSTVRFPAALPLQRWLMSASVIIAVVLAIVAAASVLALAKLTAFRPGVIWPVLAILLAGPMAIFYARVGPAELEYALIIRPLAAPDVLLGSVTLDDWCTQNQAQGLSRPYLKNCLLEDLQERKTALIDKCREFVSSHPHSKRAAPILWLQAQAHSLILDETAFEASLVQYSAAQVWEDSSQAWRQLYDEYAGSPHAALAAWRLGELALRRRDLLQGDKLLRASRKRLLTLLSDVAAEERADRSAAVFVPTPAIPARGGYGYYANALLAVERLIWLMDENGLLAERGGSLVNKRTAEALAAYLNLNRCSTDYAANLERLAGQYEDTQMGDNLKL
ncbi:MAG: hypothetical protein J7M14_05610, partial [Planctomycetes bacterium]|nr:hypothetical protein [Planctomycetota bacterium]